MVEDQIHNVTQQNITLKEKTVLITAKYSRWRGTQLHYYILSLFPGIIISLYHYSVKKCVLEVGLFPPKVRRLTGMGLDGTCMTT